MAVTVADDFTTIDDAENATGWTIFGPPFEGAPSVRGNAAQGNNALGRLVVGTGLGGLNFDSGAANVDITNEHVLFWIFPAGFSFDTEANGGLRIRISTAANGQSNFGEWSVGGEDTAIAYKLGTWRCYAADSVKPFDFVTGTPPAITAIRSFAGVFDITGVEPESSQGFVDEVKRGTGITITGGAATPRGSPEVASNDDTNGRGTFRDVGGAYYVMGRITIGDVTASTNSTFDDTNKVWVFQDLPVSATFHKIEFVGGTGTNRATFGSSSGTGNAKEGAGGNTFVAGGDIPFRIEAIDSEITAELFGCTLTGPTALRDDAVRNFKFEDSGTGFTDDTRDANDPGTGDTPAMPATQALNDASYFGHDERFYELNIDLGTAKGGTWTGTWEYFNGASWVSLKEVTDGTSNYATTGPQTVTYAIPDDWAKTTVDTDNRYWIRFRISSFTSSGTVPNIDECSVAMAGDVRWEHTNAEAIRCTFTNMGSIRVRSSAKLKKCIISDSVVPAKHAALDLGSADPAADTVRDLTIQNCARGVLVRPGATATVTYSFKNIKFAGNTFDVLNDGPATETDIYAVANQNATTALNDTVHGAAQSVTGDGNVLSRARFYLSKTGTPTGTAVAKLYAHSGVFGTSSIPTGAALATSETLDVSTLTGALTLTDFEFRDEFTLVNLTNYVIAIEYTAGTAANTVNVGTDTTTPTHGGNFATADTVFTWTAVAGTDAIFTLLTGSIAKINVTDAGDTPSVETLHGATIVQNTVTLTVQVNDPDGVAVQGARVRIENDPAGTLIAEGTTDASGTFTDTTFNFVSDTNVTTKVRLKGWKFFRTSGVIKSTGLTVGVRFEPDKIVDLP